MVEELLLVEKNQKICTLSFNRPARRNALSAELLFQLAHPLTEIQRENETRCLVIRGVGDKAFSAGYDISDIPANTTPEKAETFKTKNPLQTGLQAILQFPYPIIAIINGAVYGAGCELASTCDIRIASDKARLSMPPAKLGIVYHWEGYSRFINLIGLANTKEMFLTGRSYDAFRAKEMGLVNYVVPFDQFESFTYGMAKEIAENAPFSLSSGKKISSMILRYQRLDPEIIKEMNDLRDQSFSSEDCREGQRAFIEKRAPVFKGRERRGETGNPPY